MNNQDFGDVRLPAFLQLPPLEHMLRMPSTMLNKLQTPHKRVGVTFGAFDLGHAGHITMFWEAKALGLCDILFAGIQSNPQADRPTKNKPSETLLERHIRIHKNPDVDMYAMYDSEEDLYRFLHRYARANGGFIDIRILDEEYKVKKYTGQEIPIDVHFNWRGHPWSTSTLKERIYEDVAHQKAA